MILFIIVLSVLLLTFSAALYCMIGATDIHFHRDPGKDRIRVACIGDSITNGALIPGCFFLSYPSQLQKLLGKKYQVENFGLNDRTLQLSGHMPYAKEKEFRESLEFAPDIVIILLGTNDTKTKNWRGEEHFIEEYRSFLKNYTCLEKRPDILLCTPPWSVDASNIFTRYTNDTSSANMPSVVSAVKTVGVTEAFPVADLYPLFENHRDLLSCDGVHPNVKGAAVIAGTVYESITGFNREAQFHM